ncbi:MAG: hypothetical protein ACRDU8_03410 [Egibacteraceae bacterium]
MRRWSVFVLAIVPLLLPVAPAAAQATGDTAVSDQVYVRHDGGSDATIADCSVNNRQQNEPSAAVSAQDADLMVAGANDYCPVDTAGGTWAGFYYSSNGGQTWTDSLLPGYPTDTSAEGQASPLFGLTSNAGDPVQEWDNDDHVYYGGIAFNRTQPANGSIWLARYAWDAGPAPDYEFTTLVSRGASSPLFIGNFEDKVQLGVDRGANSPHEGNVYMCWARFNANTNSNSIFFARSDDGGRSFVIKRISRTVVGNQFCDIAVTSSGHVYVGWRQYENTGQGVRAQDNALVVAKSTNGGKSFGAPRVAAKFLSWDPGDEYASPPAAGRARFDGCRNADLTPGACRSPEPQIPARDCGDGPLACESGYVFHRANSQIRLTADPTTAGDPNAVYAIIDASVPGSQTPTGTTYGTVGQGIGTQAQVYLTKTANGGGSWSAPARIDPQARGHQYFPDLVAESGQLHAVWQDSRNDTASGPPSTPSGGDFRTVPPSNRWVPDNPPGGVSTGTGVETVYATSVNGGATWSSEIVSEAVTMPQYEQFGNRDVPFFGDYNYASAAGDTVLLTWTDQRDTVPGDDPRYPVDGADGFDVLQCRAQQPDGTFGPDTCPNAGGLDQNIYGTTR